MGDGTLSAGRFVDSVWWKVYILGGPVAWAAVTVAVAASRPPGEDSLAVRLTTAIAGGLYFTGIFVASARSSASGAQKRAQAVRHRLMLRPDHDAERRGQSLSRQVRIVYIGLAALSVAVLMSMIAVGTMGYAVVGMGALAVITAVFCGYFLYAYAAVIRSTNAFVSGLGLKLVRMPAYLRVPALTGGSLSGFTVGAAVYRGVRHGRPVHIVQEGARAATLVGEPSGDGSGLDARIGPERMAAITGKPPSSWKRVAVLYGSSFVAVRRDGNGAGQWMFHDLLLAEALLAANTQPAT